jgi:hypothetical protein
MQSRALIISPSKALTQLDEAMNMGILSPLRQSRSTKSRRAETLKSGNAEQANPGVLDLPPALNKRKSETPNMIMISSDLSTKVHAK